VIKLEEQGIKAGHCLLESHGGAWKLSAIHSSFESDGGGWGVFDENEPGWAHAVVIGF